MRRTSFVFVCGCAKQRVSVRVGRAPGGPETRWGGRHGRCGSSPIERERSRDQTRACRAPRGVASQVRRSCTESGWLGHSDNCSSEIEMSVGAPFRLRGGGRLHGRPGEAAGTRPNTQPLAGVVRLLPRLLRRQLSRDRCGRSPSSPCSRPCSRPPRRSRSSAPRAARTTARVAAPPRGWTRR